MMLTTTKQLNGDQQIFQEIIAELKKPFPPEVHKDRTLPGGGRWLYIPWQAIRDRLDEVCPEWSVSWSEPTLVGEHCVILCTITIAGVSRQAPGNAPIQMLSSSGKDMSRGTPVERATADAFKNAAESFGAGRYIDDQVFTANYLSKKGDMRGYKYAKENGEIAVGARGIPVKPKVESKNETPSLLKSQTSKPDRDSLMRESDRLIADLKWSASQGKEYLMKNYNKSGRSLLTDAELLDFVGKLQRNFDDE